MKREKNENVQQGKQIQKGAMLTGVIICILAGLFSSGCNIAYHIGGNIGKIDIISVEKYGNPAWLSGISVWTLIFIGGGLSSVSYSIFTLFRNNSWKGFTVRGSGKNLSLTMIMALAHFACLFFYGLGGWKVGELGTSVGFAIFQSGSILIGNSLGFATGEWKNAGTEARRWVFGGLSVLILGIIVVSVGNIL